MWFAFFYLFKSPSLRALTISFLLCTSFTQLQLHRTVMREFFSLSRHNNPFHSVDFFLSFLTFSIWTWHFYNLKYSKASRCAVFGSRKNPCSSKPRFVRLHLCSKIFFFQKIRVSARLLAKIRVSQVFLDPIKNRVSLRSALFKAVYLEALL